jgi:hypothetical protein
MAGERLNGPSIAELNDEYRRTGLPILTISVFLLPDFEGAIQAVREYDDFDENNDPYGEHDFGAFDWGNDRVFWKIDYTDRDTGVWRDPLDPECQRVLTIMTAEDY